MNPEQPRQNDQEHPPLRKVCAWCKKVMQEGALSKDGRESHGMCDECRKSFFDGGEGDG